MKLTQAVKNYFKTLRYPTEHTVEFMQKFVMPYWRKWREFNPSGTVDEALADFFHLNDRKVYHANALKDFNMPGQWMKTAGVGTYHAKGPRAVKRGQYMLLVVDRVDGTAKVEIELAGKYRIFTLQRFEFETLKDWIDVSETVTGLRHRD